MTFGPRARFVAAYSRLVADVWSDPASEELLEQDAAALVSSYDIVLPEGCLVEVVRDSGEAYPDLEQQIRAWEDSFRSGRLILYLPALDPITELELTEYELDDVVAGLSTTCACCCPCCCTA